MATATLVSVFLSCPFPEDVLPALAVFDGQHSWVKTVRNLGSHAALHTKMAAAPLLPDRDQQPWAWAGGDLGALPASPTDS